MAILVNAVASTVDSEATVELEEDGEGGHLEGEDAGLSQLNGKSRQVAAGDGSRSDGEEESSEDAIQ